MKRFFNFPRHIGCASSSIANTAMLDAQHAVANVEALGLRVSALEMAVGTNTLKPIGRQYIYSLT